MKVQLVLKEKIGSDSYYTRHEGIKTNSLFDNSKKQSSFPSRTYCTQASESTLQVHQIKVFVFDKCITRKHVLNRTDPMGKLSNRVFHETNKKLNYHVVKRK